MSRYSDLYGHHGIVKSKIVNGDRRIFPDVYRHKVEVGIARALNGTYLLQLQGKQTRRRRIHFPRAHRRPERPSSWGTMEAVESKLGIDRDFHGDPSEHMNLRIKLKIMGIYQRICLCVYSGMTLLYDKSGLQLYIPYSLLLRAIT